MDGFLVLVRLADQVEAIPRESGEQFVWKRLLYYFTQQHAKLQAEQGPEKANATLRVLVAWTPSAVAHVDLCGTTFVPSSSNISDDPLTLNMLQAPLRPDILDDLEKAGEYFGVLQNTSKCHASLAVFINLLLASVEGPTTIKDALSFFTLLHYETEKLVKLEGGSCNLFAGSGLVTEEMAGRMISSLEK